MEAIEQRLKRLESRHEVMEHLYSYCRHADLLDPEGMVKHYTKDCVVSYGSGYPPLVGKTELQSMLAEFFTNSTSSQHMIANPELIFTSDDEVILHTYMYSWQRFRAYPQRSDTHRWGRYECRAIRAGEGWLFSHMNLVAAGEYGETRIGEQFEQTWPPRFNLAD